MEKLLSEFSVGLFFWQSILFALLLALLYKFAWNRILKALDDREESIDNALKSAEKAREDVANLKSENENILREAKEERAKIINEANTIKDKMVNDAKEKAKLEAEKIITETKEAIENQKMAAIIEVKNHVAHLSLEIAEKVMKQKLEKEDTQEKFIGELLEEIK